MSNKLEQLQVEYAEVCNTEKEIAAKKADLKAQIEDILPQKPVDIKTDYGTFKMVSQPKWDYSPAVKRLEEDVKILKVEEQEQGLATKTETFGLRFNAPRPKNDA